METGQHPKTIPEILKQVKFSSMEWTHDHKGIFYNVCFHMLCICSLLLSQLAPLPPRRVKSSGVRQSKIRKWTILAVKEERQADRPS